MDRKLNWGIIGTGQIARTLADALQYSTTGKLFAVASRTKETADRFGGDFHIDSARCYGCYDDILRDADVHAIYVATPHPQHAEWAIKAADAGKHVLVEKPMAVNHRQAQTIIDAAIANNIFLMEAFMYRCHPKATKLVELIKQKVIGEVRIIQATFSFHAEFNPTSRLFANALAGGAILDIGCYPASMSRLIAGAATGHDFADPIEVKAVGHLESTGIDGYTVAVLKFPGDIIAQLSAGVCVNQENVVRIFGSKGWLYLPNPWVVSRTAPDTSRIFVHKDGEKEPQEIVLEASANSFTLETDVFGRAVNAGQKQAGSPAMSWADSLGNMKTLDAWRAQIGVLYDFEKAMQ